MGHFLLYQLSDPGILYESMTHLMKDYSAAQISPACMPHTRGSEELRHRTLPQPSLYITLRIAPDFIAAHTLSHIQLSHQHAGTYTQT